LVGRDQRRRPTYQAHPKRKTKEEKMKNVSITMLVTGVTLTIIGFVGLRKMFASTEQAWADVLQNPMTSTWILALALSAILVTGMGLVIFSPTAMRHVKR
jgi:succinate dehydrogenase hydrophobic anchor subunit